MRNFYITWTVIVVLLSFMQNGWSSDTITRIVVIGILFFSLWWFKNSHPTHPKRFYILSGVFLASLVEGAYMISRPVTESLIVDVNNFNIGTFVHHYAIDLILTIPAYLLIFWVMWRLLNKYHFTKWQYIIVFGFGQAIGDGNSFFIANPLSLWLVPYVMLNYHAMNIAPYLAVKDSLDGKVRSRSKWRYLVVVVSIFLTYIVVGGTIKTIVNLLNI